MSATSSLMFNDLVRTPKEGRSPLNKMEFVSCVQNNTAPACGTLQELRGMCAASGPPLHLVGLMWKTLSCVKTEIKSLFIFYFTNQETNIHQILSVHHYCLPSSILSSLFVCHFIISFSFFVDPISSCTEAFCFIQLLSSPLLQLCTKNTQ